MLISRMASAMIAFQLLTVSGGSLIALHPSVFDVFLILSGWDGDARIARCILATISLLAALGAVLLLGGALQ